MKDDGIERKILVFSTLKQFVAVLILPNGNSLVIGDPTIISSGCLIENSHHDYMIRKRRLPHGKCIRIKLYRESIIFSGWPNGQEITEKQYNTLMILMESLENKTHINAIQTFLDRNPISQDY